MVLDWLYSYFHSTEVIYKIPKRKVLHGFYCAIHRLLKKPKKLLVFSMRSKYECNLSNSLLVSYPYIVTETYYKIKH